METLSFTQDELKLLIAVFNKLFNQGGLGIGDAINITPLAQKIQAKIVVEQPTGKEEPNHVIDPEIVNPTTKEAKVA